MKLCPTCRMMKERSAFYADIRTPDGLKSQCKACHIDGNIRTRDPQLKRRLNREHMARARLADPEKFRARDRARSPRCR